MKRIFTIILLFSGFGTAYSQDKSLYRIKTDTIVFINFSESDLVAQKKMRLLEARQQNRISDAWDLKQFYVIDSKRFKRDKDKLNRELEAGRIKYKFISVPRDSSATNSTGDNCTMTTDFKVEESKNGKYLMIYETSTLLDKDGRLIMDGNASGIIKELRRKK